MIKVVTMGKYSNDSQYKKILYIHKRKHAISSSEVHIIPKSVPYQYKLPKLIWFRNLKRFLI